MSISEYFRFLAEWFYVINSATYWLLGVALLFGIFFTKALKQEYCYSRFPWHLLIREFIKCVIWLLVFYYLLVRFVLMQTLPEKKCLPYHYAYWDEPRWCIMMDNPKTFFGLYNVEKEIEEKFKLNCPIRWTIEPPTEIRRYKWEKKEEDLKQYYLPWDPWYPNLTNYSYEIKNFCSEDEAIAEGYQRKKM